MLLITPPLGRRRAYSSPSGCTTRPPAGRRQAYCRQAVAPSDVAESFFVVGCWSFARFVNTAKPPTPISWAARHRQALFFLRCRSSVTLKLVPRPGNFLTACLAATGFHIFFLFLLYTSLSKKSQTLVMNVDTHVSRFVDRIELFFFRRRGYVVRSLPRGEIVCKLCCYLPRTVYNSELVYSFI